MYLFKKDKIKGVLLLAILFILSATQIAEADKSIDLPKKVNAVEVIKVNNNNTDQITTCQDGATNYVLMLKDCRVHLQSDNYDLIVVIEQISWFTCTKLQVAAWWQRTFG